MEFLMHLSLHPQTPVVAKVLACNGVNFIRINCDGMEITIFGRSDVVLSSTEAERPTVVDIASALASPADYLAMEFEAAEHDREEAARGQDESNALKMPDRDDAWPF